MLKTFMLKKYNYLIIFAVISLLYLPTVFYEFVWDDILLIINNTASHSLKDFFNILKDYPLTNNKQMISRPLVFFTFACNFSLTDSAWVFHVFNILLHAINICLLYKLIGYFKTSSKKYRLSLCLIYGILPIHAGAVTYIAGRSELISSFFILLSLINFLIFFKEKTIKNLTISSILTMLACFAKETAVTVILLTSLYILLYENKSKKIINTIKYSIIPFSLSILPYTIWHIVYSLHPLHINAESMYTLKEISPVLRLLVFLQNIPTYLNLLFNPFANIYIEVSKTINLNLSFRGLLPLTIILAFIFLIYKNFKNKNFQNVFFLSWFFAALLPYSNIIIATMLHPKAHFLYIPAIGIIFITFEQVTNFFKKYSTEYKYILPIALAVVLLLVGGRTVYINTKWKTKESLYLYNLNQNPEKIHFNLGLLFTQKQQYGKAEQHLQKSISYSLIDIKNTYNSLLKFYISDEKTTQKIKEQINITSSYPLYLNEIKNKTNNNIFIQRRENNLKAELHKNMQVTFSQLKASLLTLSSVYIAQKKYQKAKDTLNNVLYINVEDNNDYGLFYNMGIVEEKQKNYTAAKKYYQKSFDLNNKYTPASEGIKRIN